MSQGGRLILKGAVVLVAALSLSACSTSRSGQEGPRARRGGDQEASLGVNSYLWRASLDTLNFMPLASADPFGGVIITDWYSAASTPNERFKATVYILDTRLRADALNVSIFRQEQVNGVWTDAAVNPDTEIQIENAILQRARELRLSNVR
ncbi:MAG: DUF3576 domain-containing protein [Hyphomonadaceae bacterium]